MKKILLSSVLLVFILLSGCARTPVSNSQRITNHYTTICKTQNSSVIRKELAELEQLCKDSTLTKKEQMFAQYSYNIGCAIAKLWLSGKPISVFDFPEMEILNSSIGAVATGELEVDEKMISESEKFLKKVQEFVG